MKKLMLGLFALTLALCVAATVQAFAQQSGSQQDQNYSNQSQNDPNQNNAKSNQNMSGSVSSNGENFTNDKDNENYKVDNPAALKGHEGQHVAVIVHVDPDTGFIHIMQVEVPDQQ
ncbi:MAG: hypothetical protein WBV69_01590 [Candidatus Sulfotelmatobacter sp.]